MKEFEQINEILEEQFHKETNGILNEKWEKIFKRLSKLTQGVKLTTCINCENDFEVSSEMFVENYYPHFCIFCGQELKLSYELLKEQVCKVKLNRSLNLGNLDDIIQGEDQWFLFNRSLTLETDNENEVYLNGAEDIEICVQPHNFNYEIKLQNGLKFDISFDTDEELNEDLQLIEIIDINKYFFKD